jgi:hypothetical protein
MANPKNGVHRSRIWEGFEEIGIEHSEFVRVRSLEIEISFNGSVPYFVIGVRELSEEAGDEPGQILHRIDKPKSISLSNIQ